MQVHTDLDVIANLDKHKHGHAVSDKKEDATCNADELI